MLQTNPGMIDMANFHAKQQHFAACRMQDAADANAP
jgi:hypothetical protein